MDRYLGITNPLTVRGKKWSKIIIKAEKLKCKIYQPDHYSEINLWRNIKNTIKYRN